MAPQMRATEHLSNADPSRYSHIDKPEPPSNTRKLEWKRKGLKIYRDVLEHQKKTNNFC